MYGIEARDHSELGDKYRRICLLRMREYDKSDHPEVGDEYR